MKTFGNISSAPGQLQPDCSFRRDEDDSTKETLVYTGKYAELKTWVTGQTQKDGVSYELEGTPGTLGKLKVITGTGRWSNALEDGPDGVTYDWYFSDFRPYARPLESDVPPGGGAGYSRNDLSLWKTEPDAGLKKATSYTNPDTGAVVALSGEAKGVAQKIARGNITRQVWLPILERERRYVGNSQPQPENVGVVIPDNAIPPEFPALPLTATDYQWRKVSDRARPADITNKNNRVWIRQERWVSEIKESILNDA